MVKARGMTSAVPRPRNYQEVVLGDRDGQAVGIDLLKGVGADHRLRHLPGDGDDGDRIELGIGDRRQQVGRAGPDDARQTAGLPVARAMPCAMKPAPCS